MLCQSKMAVLLPIRIVGYTSFENGVEYREQFTAYGHEGVHLRLACLNAAVEISVVSGNASYGSYGKHPDNPPNIPIASVAHSGVFGCVATRLEGLQTPAEMGQELLYRGEAMDILSFRHNGS